MKLQIKFHLIFKSLDSNTVILIPQCFQTISAQILETYSELCIKMAVFKDLFILKGRKSILFAKCYS